MTKSCELCGEAAGAYCESDGANLCWSCDAKVHSANFLVARHSRTLLCRLCHSLTPWKASGSKLAPTFSVCHACANRTETNDLDDGETPPLAESSSTGEDEEEEEETFSRRHKR